MSTVEPISKIIQDMFNKGYSMVSEDSVRVELLNKITKFLDVGYSALYLNYIMASFLVFMGLIIMLINVRYDRKYIFTHVFLVLLNAALLVLAVLNNQENDDGTGIWRIGIHSVLIVFSLIFVLLSAKVKKFWLFFDNILRGCNLSLIFTAIISALVGLVFWMLDAQDKMLDAKDKYTYYAYGTPVMFVLFAIILTLKFYKGQNWLAVCSRLASIGSLLFTIGTFWMIAAFYNFQFNREESYAYFGGSVLVFFLLWILAYGFNVDKDQIPILENLQKKLEVDF